jgi:hypothetical protein
VAEPAAREPEVAEPEAAKAPEPAVNADRVDSKALPPAPESGDDEATTKIKEQARELLALALESAAKAGITAGAADAKIWNILKPVLGAPPVRQAAMLDALRAKLTADFAKPEKLASLLGASAADAAGAASGAADPPPTMKQVLGTTLPGADEIAGEPSGKPGLVAFARTRLEWEDAKKQAANDLANLRQAVEGDAEEEEDATIFAAAVSRLEQVMARFQEGLGDALDDLANADEPGKISASKARAGQIVDGYLAHISSDPVLAHIEHNPYVAAPVAATLRAPLEKVRAQLAAAA